MYLYVLCLASNVIGIRAHMQDKVTGFVKSVAGPPRLFLGAPAPGPEMYCNGLCMNRPETCIQTEVWKRNETMTHKTKR